MAENKKSFLLYCDIIHTVKKLSDEQAGSLFKIILSYVNDENPIVENVIIDLVFEPIKQGLKRDLRRYESICNRNKINGEKGGRPHKEPKKPNGLINNPKKPKKADIDNDIDSDIDNDKEKNKNIKVFIKPTIEQISEYCLQRKNNVDAERFFYHYESNGWIVGKTKMKDWKGAVITWEKNNNFGKQNGTHKPEIKQTSNPYWDLLLPEYR